MHKNEVIYWFYKKKFGSRLIRLLKSWCVATMRRLRKTVMERSRFMKFGKELWEIKHLAEVYLGVSDLVEAQMGMSVFLLNSVLSWVSLTSSILSRLNFQSPELLVVCFWQKMKKGLDFCVTIIYYLCVTKRKEGINVTKDR